MWFSVHSKIRSSWPLLCLFTVQFSRCNWIENRQLCGWYNSTETIFSSLLHTRFVTPQKPLGAAQLIAAKTHFFLKHIELDARSITPFMPHSCCHDERLYGTFCTQWRKLDSCMCVFVCLLHTVYLHIYSNRQTKKTHTQELSMQMEYSNECWGECY